MAELELIAVNSGSTPTFQRGESISYIDITLVAEKIADKVTNWAVSEEENMTLHNYITYELNDRDTEDIPLEDTGTLGWIIKEDKMNTYVEIIRRKTQLLEEPMTPDRFTEMITRTCNEVFVKKNQSRGKRTRSVYWWTKEIGDQRKECHKTKRAMTRINKKPSSTIEQKEDARNEYKRNRNKLKKMIERAKEEAWNNLIKEVDADIWGQGYKIVTGKFSKRRQGRLSADDMIKAARSLFPSAERIVWERDIVEEQSIPQFTTEEILAAADRMKLRKAPGPDCIPAEIIQITARQLTLTVQKIMNYILVTGDIPSTWKTARLVLVEKPKKQGQEEIAHRPLCIINNQAKLLESLIKERINSELEARGGLSPEQYGFTKGKSTLDAIQSVLEIAVEAKAKAYQNRELCILVTLDIKNAFNTAPWEGIIEALKERDIPPYLIRMVKSYLSNRTLMVGSDIMEITRGVPQGSVIGPLLWNIYYDGILRLRMPQGVKLVGYADDLAIVVKGSTQSMVTQRANHAVEMVCNWLREKDLQLAVEKTEAVILAGRRYIKEVQLEIMGTNINTIDVIKYLGVYIDKGSTMKTHILKTCAKAEEKARQLSRIMPNIKGPTANKRRILSSVVHSIMLYAAPSWSTALRYKKYADKMRSIQRRMAIKISSAYRTVSSEAVLVVSRVIPIDLLVDERSRTYGKEEEIRALERRETVNIWQRRWQDNVTVGQWTKTLIPNVLDWLHRKHGETNYYITQFLTGHGCFEAYLYRFKIRDSPSCMYCREYDDAEHTILRCPRWADIRRRTETVLGQALEPYNIINMMIRSSESWDLISKMIGCIMMQKELDERRLRDEVDNEQPDGI